MRTIVVAIAAWGAGCGGCTEPRSGDRPPASVSVPSSAGQAAPEPFGSAAPMPESKTPDGVPILAISAASPSTTSGALRPLSSARETLEYATFEATDGRSVYFALREQGQSYTDILVRGGKLRMNVLSHLAAAAENPGGCAAAADGVVLLSAPVPSERPGSKDQAAWLMRRDGSIEPHRLPPMTGSGTRCKAWLDADGTFAVAEARLTTFEHGVFRVDDVWSDARLQMPGAKGPPMCFRSCSEREKAVNPEVARVMQDKFRDDADYAVFDRWVVGYSSRARRAVRIDRTKVPLTPEILEGIPESKSAYSSPVALTLSGDVVLGLAIKMKSYAVWSIKTGKLGEVRALAPGEALASASPTLLVKNLPDEPPPSQVAAVLIGRSSSYGAGGSTYGYDTSLDGRGDAAWQAQVARARAVMPSGRLFGVHDAIVEMDCGAYVRSPVGWEEMRIMDWTPPKLPPLSPKAVFHPKSCFPLETLGALPGAADLLLARTKDGQLAAAWLPTPLPLPTGGSRGRPPEATPPKQDPKPGSGWTKLGAVDAFEALVGGSAPNVEQRVPPGTWGIGGGAILRVGATRILALPRGASVVPAGAKPMAVRPDVLAAYGAIGPKLVACDPTCRTLDVGLDAPIASVIPRTEHDLILVVEDGRAFAYTVPPTGGVSEPDHPLAEAFRRFVAARAP